MNTTEIVISKDTFLQVLNLKEIETELRSPTARDALFYLAVEYLESVGAITGSAHKSFVVANELPIKIPGSAITVRLGRPDRDDLKTLIGIGSLVLGTGSSDTKTLTAAAVMALSSRVKLLQAKYGERSIIDALLKVPVPTIDNATRFLNGKECRYPKSSCRFLSEESAHCTVTPPQVKETVEALVSKSILRQLNTVEPLEYGLAI